MQYATYKYYDKQGRRLAVFCRYITPLDAEIVTIACSKHDQFNKAFAREQYQIFLAAQPVIVKPHVTTVTIKPEWGEIKTLINYCQENYYKYYDFDVNVQVLLSANAYSYGKDAPIFKLL